MELSGGFLLILFLGSKVVRNRHHMDSGHCLTQFVSPHMLPATLSLEAHDEVQNVGHVLGVSDLSFSSPGQESDLFALKSVARVTHMLRHNPTTPFLCMSARGLTNVWADERQPKKNGRNVRVIKFSNASVPLYYCIYAPPFLQSLYYLVNTKHDG